MRSPILDYARSQTLPPYTAPTGGWFYSIEDVTTDGSLVLFSGTTGRAGRKSTSEDLAAIRAEIGVDVPLTFSPPLSRSVNTISIPVATSSANGYLSLGDWTAFNAKVGSTETVSVDGQVVLFNSTTGKSIRKTSGTGIAKLASGVLSVVTAPTGDLVGHDDTQTLYNKTLSLGTLVSNLGLNFERPSGAGIISLLAQGGAASLNVFLPSVAGTLTTAGEVSATYQPLLGFTPVPNTRTVNGHALSSNVTVTPTDLGLVIGTNVQAYGVNLDVLSGAASTAISVRLLHLDPPGTASYIKVATNGALSYKTTSDLVSDLGLVIGTNVEAWLNNPGFDGALLSSSSAGVRSWVHAPLSLLATASNWIRSYDADTGLFTKSRPAIADLSDAGTLATWAGLTASNYALLASPTFTGTVGLPGGQALSGPNITGGNFNGDTQLNSTGGGDILLRIPSIASEIVVTLPATTGELALVSDLPTSVDFIPTDSLDTDVTLSSDSDLLVPSQKAVKAYVDESAEFVAKTANYTAVSGDNILADTSGGAFTITLPASPSVGAVVTVVDAQGTFATNNLTVGRNSQLIAASAANMTASTNDAAFQLIFAGGAIGWQVVRYQ